MFSKDPRQSGDAKKPANRSEAADSASLPTIDLGDEGAVDIGDFQLQGDGSAIPLAELPAPPSGQSLTSWTEVIRRQRAAQAAVQASEPVQVDAPSDKDLLDRVNVGQAPGSGVQMRTGDTSEIRPSDLPVYSPPLATPASESDIDLGRPSPGSTVGGSEVGFDILFPPEDAGGAIPFSHADLRRPEPSSSLSSEVIPMAAVPGPGISGVDLGAAIGPSEPGRSSILDVLLRESSGGLPPAAEPPGSAYNLDEFTGGRGHKPTMPSVSLPPERPTKVPTHPGIHVPRQPSVQLPPRGQPTASDIDLSGPASAFGSDEDVDLLAEGSRPPSISDSGTLEIAEEAMAASQRRADELESSSVDMNSPPVTPSKFDVNVPSEVATAAADRKSDSDVDLALPLAADDGSSSLIRQYPELAADQSALAAELDARRQRKARREIVPSRDDDDVPPARRRGYLLHGGIIGLLLGAGGVLAAYFGGALPDRHAKTETAPTDNSAALAQARQEAEAAKKDAVSARTDNDALRKSLTDVNIDPDRPADAFKQFAADKAARDEKIKELTAAAKKAATDLDAATKAASAAKTAETSAKTALANAEKAAKDAKLELTDAVKAIEAAKADTLAAKKAGEDALKVAEAKEKDLSAKLAESTKKEGDLQKLADAAKKSADEARKAGEDAAKSRDANAATLNAIAERLAKAKFVGEKPESSALVKGLDDAIKAATTDATATLRDELAKARAQEAKTANDLAAAKQKAADSEKSAASLRDSVTKLKADADKSKTEVDSLSKQIADATAKANAAETAAAQHKAAVDKLTNESQRLRTENERLTRDIATVRELAEMIKNQPGAFSSSHKVDPSKLADRFFGEGLRAFHSGEYAGAESSFRKAIQFRADDARYQYLLGLTLWLQEDRKGAEGAFEKGRELEMEARPPSRAISSALERIQGPARQAVNAYRP